MENRPEYLFAWLGIVKLGGVVALINTNLRGQPLAHSIAIADARHAIVGRRTCRGLSRSRRAAGNADPIAWVTGGRAAGAEDLDAALAEASPAPLDSAVRDGLVCKDKAFYIYTSGTTGLPKAANFSHMRMLFMMYGFAGALNAGEQRPHVQRAAALSFGRRRVRAGRGADWPAARSSSAANSRCTNSGTIAIATSRRSSSISASSAAIC